MDLCMNAAVTGTPEELKAQLQQVIAQMEANHQAYLLTLLPEARAKEIEFDKMCKLPEVQYAP
jgi:hypothetical protein